MSRKGNGGASKIKKVNVVSGLPSSVALAHQMAAAMSRCFGMAGCTLRHLST